MDRRVAINTPHFSLWLRSHFHFDVIIISFLLIVTGLLASIYNHWLHGKKRIRFESPVVPNEHRQAVRRVTSRVQLDVRQSFLFIYYFNIEQHCLPSYAVRKECIEQVFTLFEVTVQSNQNDKCQLELSKWINKWKKTSDKRRRNKSTTPLLPLTLVCSLGSGSPLMKFPGIGALIICAGVQVWPLWQPYNVAIENLSLSLPSSDPYHFSLQRQTFCWLVSDGKKEKLRAKTVCFASTKDAPETDSVTVLSSKCTSVVPAARLCFAQNNSGEEISAFMSCSPPPSPSFLLLHC